MRMWALAVGLMAAVPAFAQSPAAGAARNAMNWETLVKNYPPRALAAREQGMVGFLVRLDSKGQPTQCQVTHSSGYPLLDQETCQLITLHAVFKPAAGLSQSQISTHQGVVNWRLPGATAAAPAAAPKPVRVADAPDKLVCKRVPRTGSNVGTERVCLRKSDWAKAADETRKDWEEVRGKGMTSGN